MLPRHLFPGALLVMPSRTTYPHPTFINFQLHSSTKGGVDTRRSAGAEGALDVVVASKGRGREEESGAEETHRVWLILSSSVD